MQTAKQYFQSLAQKGTEEERISALKLFRSEQKALWRFSPSADDLADAWQEALIAYWQTTGEAEELRQWQACRIFHKSIAFSSRHQSRHIELPSMLADILPEKPKREYAAKLFRRIRKDGKARLASALFDYIRGKLPSLGSNTAKGKLLQRERQYLRRIAFAVV